MFHFEFCSTVCKKMAGDGRDGKRPLHGGRYQAMGTLVEDDDALLAHGGN